MLRRLFLILPFFLQLVWPSVKAVATPSGADAGVVVAGLCLDADSSAGRPQPLHIPCPMSDSCLACHREWRQPWLVTTIVEQIPRLDPPNPSKFVARDRVPVLGARREPRRARAPPV
jgi:hypothetical protein